ncbi:MAG: single-stranded DNA-binding protein [Terriglobia bacterium]
MANKRSWKNAQGEYESRTYWHHAVAWNRLAEFATTLKKGMHVQLVDELRTREYEKEYGNRKKFTVKRRVCEIALQSILKLDRPLGFVRQDPPAPDVDPSELPAESETERAAVPTGDIPY